MKPQNVRYFIREATAPDANPGILVDVSVEGVPLILNGLEIRKARRNWATQQDWEEGYQWLARQQEAFLMDASNRIISEIRQVRGPKPGQDITETFDPDVTPIYNGTSLFDVLYNSTSGLEGVNEKLQLLVDDMSEEDRAAILAQLTRIAVAIAGAPV